MKPLSAYIFSTLGHEERYAWRPVRLEDGWCWLRNYIVVNRRIQVPSTLADAPRLASFRENIVYQRRISTEQWLMEKFKG